LTSWKKGYTGKIEEET